MIGVALLTAWVLTYAGAAGVAVCRHRTRTCSPPRARSRSPSPSLPRTLLLRPLAGAEPGLHDRLLAAAGASSIMFAVGDEHDPALPTAHAAAQQLRLRDIDARVMVTHAVGPNHKADQLARALASAPASSFVVIADSDVDLRGTDLEALVEMLSDRTIGAAWAPPVESGAVVTWGDQASQAILDASLHAFPLLAGIDPNGLVGKLFAMRRDVLAEVGGFEALVSVLGEDMELARRLRAHGYRTAVAAAVSRGVAQGRPLRDVIARYTRWLLVIRTQRPRLLLSYPLLLAPAPLLLVVLAAGALLHAPAMVALAAAGLFLRFLVACFARSAAGEAFAPLQATAQALLADATLLVALVRALAAREVAWRGRRFSLRRKQPREEALGEPTEPAGRAGEDGCEVARRATVGDGCVDAPKGVLDAGLLESDRPADVTLRSERLPEGDPQVGVLRRAEHVAQPNGNHRSALRHASNLRGPRPQRERRERRALAALGKDPQRAAPAIQQSRRVADGARTIAGVVEIDAERADAAKERNAAEVLRVHHRVPVAPEQELRRVESDEGVPPRGVVGDGEDGRACGDGTHLLEPGDEDTAERALDPGARMPGEPRVEPAVLGGCDHEASS